MANRRPLRGAFIIPPPQGAVTDYGYGLVDAAEAAGDPPSPPAAPSGLLATAVSSTQIDLSWTDNSSSESGFKRSTQLARTSRDILILT